MACRRGAAPRRLGFGIRAARWCAACVVFTFLVFNDRGRARRARFVRRRAGVGRRPSRRLEECIACGLRMACGGRSARTQGALVGLDSGGSSRREGQRPARFAGGQRARAPPPFMKGRTPLPVVTRQPRDFSADVSVLSRRTSLHGSLTGRRGRGLWWQRFARAKGAAHPFDRSPILAYPVGIVGAHSCRGQPCQCCLSGPRSVAADRGSSFSGYVVKSLWSSCPSGDCKCLVSSQQKTLLPSGEQGSRKD